MATDVLAGGWAKALGGDRKQFDMFFDRMLDGFAYHKIVIDRAGKPIDYIFLEVNSAFEGLTGLKREKIIGKKVTEVLLGVENDPADWIGVYGKVALTREPIHFENHAVALGKWFKVSAYCPEKGYFVALFEDITQRKNAEGAIRESEEKFAKAFRSNTAAMTITRVSDSLILDANESFERLFGYSREEIVGHSTNQLGIWLTPGERDAEVNRLMKEGKLPEHEVIFGTKSGEHVNALFSVELISIGSQQCILSTVTDITERKKIENILKTTLDRFYKSLSDMNGAILLVTAEGLVEFANQSFCDYFYLNESREDLKGISSEVMVEKIKMGYVSPEQQVRRIKEILAAGKIVTGEEVEMVGSRTCLRDFIPTYIDEKLFSRLWHHIDITERKKAEKALNKANEELEVKVQKRTQEVSSERQRLYNVLETLPAYVVLLDKDYRMPFANKVFREIFGESHGKRCHEFLFGVDSECENCVTYKVLKTNKPQHWEWTGPNKHDYEIYDYPFVEADGSTLILEMGLDVTERKKAEQQAQEVAKKLKDTERLAAIGATAGMVGHDIRNPLQAITGDLYLVKTELAELSDNEQKKNALESLDEIQKNIDYINKIVADLQDFARPLNPRAQETDITSIFNEMLTKNGIPKNVNVTVDVEDRARNVRADPDYLKRIVQNLTLNAVQAMPDGGKLTIRAYIDKQTNETLITVSDTGVGIREDVKPKLFTPMMTTKSKGQGFGLAVVKRMTEGLGGTVTFESTEGKGTTFIVRLPAPK